MNAFRFLSSFHSDAYASRLSPLAPLHSQDSHKRDSIPSGRPTTSQSCGRAVVTHLALKQASSSISVCC